MNRRFSFAVLGVALLFSMAELAQGGIRRSSPFPVRTMPRVWWAHARVMAIRPPFVMRPGEPPGRPPPMGTVRHFATAVVGRLAPLRGMATTSRFETVPDGLPQVPPSPAIAPRTATAVVERSAVHQALASTLRFVTPRAGAPVPLPHQVRAPPFETAAAGPTQPPIRRPARQAVVPERRSSCISGSFAAGWLNSDTNVRLPHPADAGSRFLAGGPFSGAEPAATKARRQLRKLFWPRWQGPGCSGTHFGGDQCLVPTAESNAWRRPRRRCPSRSSDWRTRDRISRPELTNDPVFRPPLNDECRLLCLVGRGWGHVFSTIPVTVNPFGG